ncbi:MAG: response regulator [Gammaproteobacteria bacterium]|nr:response regulator [Gammaproteobacteria bacterium]MDH5730303.1 response regulator [Gammaproteobacteria bacterium]
MNKILVVDDNEQNRYLATYLLEHAGETCDQAVNGEQAVEQAQQNSYGLILMDVQMPIMDGIEAARIIREQGLCAKIIALTAKAMRGDEEKLLASGFDGYVAKPIDPENFIKQVKHWMLEDKIHP